MSTFSAKGSDIDVEAIMANIRKKIEEKRKGLYTEEEVKEIAEMRLDAILDSNEFNSDFVAAFRARDAQWNYSFTPETIYQSSAGSKGGLIRKLRSLLNPVLKLFFNPNPMIQRADAAIGLEPLLRFASQQHDDGSHSSEPRAHQPQSAAPDAGRAGRLSDEAREDVRADGECQERVAKLARTARGPRGPRTTRVARTAGVPGFGLPRIAGFRLPRIPGFRLPRIAGFRIE